MGQDQSPSPIAVGAIMILIVFSVIGLCTQNTRTVGVERRRAMPEEVTISFAAPASTILVETEGGESVPCPTKWQNGIVRCHVFTADRIVRILVTRSGNTCAHTGPLARIRDEDCPTLITGSDSDGDPRLCAYKILRSPAEDSP